MLCAVLKVPSLVTRKENRNFRTGTQIWCAHTFTNTYCTYILEQLVYNIIKQYIERAIAYSNPSIQWGFRNRKFKTIELRKYDAT